MSSKELISTECKLGALQRQVDLKGVPWSTKLFFNNSHGNHSRNGNCNLATKIILEAIIYVIVTDAFSMGNRGTSKNHFSRYEKNNSLHNFLCML